MHELAVCQSIMEQVERIAADRGACRVTLIEVRVGPLSGVEPRLLARAFPLASAGSVADGSSLEILPTEVRVRCTRCGEQSGARPNRLLCTACGDFRTRVVSGDELLLSRVELETPPAETAPVRAGEPEHV